MKMIDIWHGELRKFGITQKTLEDGAEFADQVNPVGAELMRKEVPKELEPVFRKLFADWAEALWAKYQKGRQ